MFTQKLVSFKSYGVFNKGVMLCYVRNHAPQSYIHEMITNDLECP